FFFSSRRRHTRLQGDWSSDVCSSDLEVDRVVEAGQPGGAAVAPQARGVHPRAGVGERDAGENGRQPELLEAEHGRDAPAKRGDRSEERRVGKECRTREAAWEEKKKKR